MRKKLGVNIDHVSTLRQARMVDYPDPLFAAAIAELAGADGITVHLREDRRHIQDRDIYLLRNAIKTGMNLEMALNPEILDIALKVIPDDVCLVPERREEITTEGGLDVLRHEKELSDFIPRLHGKGIHVSLFIDPEIKQVEAAARLKADAVELHTGRYANARGAQDTGAETARIMESVKAGRDLGLIVNAGHGLNYQNVYRIARLEGIDTLNIGHSIIAQAIFVGLDRAVRDMIAILDRAHIDTLAR